MPTTIHSGGGGRRAWIRAIRSRSVRSAMEAGGWTQPLTSSFGIVSRARLPDHGHLDLAGVLELVLDSASDVFGEPDGLFVVDLFAFDHDPDLASRLQCEGLRHAFEGI